MQSLFSSPKFIMLAIALLAVVAIPLTIIQVQNQQNIRQEAEETTVVWLTEQSAETSCPAEGDSAEIKVSFKNTEPKKTSTDMSVIVTDQQTGKKVDLGKIQGGETKTGTINSGKSTLVAGSVKFALVWSDGHSGVDSRTATYKAVSNCVKPTASPSPSPTPKPNEPTPTVCPTLAPVQNIRVQCPNCP